MMTLDLQKVEVLLEPLASSQSCELVACEWATEGGRRVLRVLLDKPGGVTLKDCEDFSRLVDPVLDVEGIISDRYDLEVSSPGMNRPLRKKEDFVKYQGDLVSIKTREPLNGRAHFKGLLKEVKGEYVCLEIDKQIFEIPWQMIFKANLEVDIGKILKNKKK